MPTGLIFKDILLFPPLVVLLLNVVDFAAAPLSGVVGLGATPELPAVGEREDLVVPAVPAKLLLAEDDARCAPPNAERASSSVDFLRWRDSCDRSFG